MELEGKVALVTGASRGIGQAVAVALAAAGADVALVARTRKGLDNTASQVEQTGRRALALEADVTDAADVDKAVEQAVAQFGKMDVLVNNAGAAILKPFLDCDKSEWQSLLDTNVLGLLAMTRAAGRRMIGTGGGSIINMGSIYGLVGAPGNSIYSLTKGGIMAVTRTLAVEWARHKIRVNAICPGWIRTEITQEHMDNPKVADSALRLIPLRRFGEPEDIGPLTVFLASEGSSYVTGQCIVVDGGQSIK